MYYGFGDYRLDTRRYELRRDGMLIELRPKVFRLLAYLLAHHDRVISREELSEHVWGYNVNVALATLDACLAEARRAVGDSGRTQRVIQTRHGFGYRFVMAVEVIDDDEPPLPPDPNPRELQRIDTTLRQLSRTPGTQEIDAKSLAATIAEKLVLVLQMCKIWCERGEMEQGEGETQFRFRHSR